jgi:uncharacterized protein (DUF952 family)
MTAPPRIFHICERAAWDVALKSGRYSGSALDRRDGFIHFSTEVELKPTAALHLRGVEGLVLLEVPTDKLGTALRWEPSRAGKLFPHLYGALETEHVSRVWDLPVGPDGLHIFPYLG